MRDEKRAVFSLFSQRTGNFSESGSLETACTATCPHEYILPIRPWPDFSVVFESYAGRAEHWPRRPRWLGRGLSGAIFSGPHDCAYLVNFHQAVEIALDNHVSAEYFDFRGTFR